MDLYRITFHTRGFFDKHFDAVLDNATHFHVMRNNIKIAEHRNLKDALENVNKRAGGNTDLEYLINHVSFLENQDTRYICTGFSYVQKYGYRLEMRLQKTSVS